MGNIQMTDYTLSDLPRLIVKSIPRIHNPVRHNRQLVGVTAFSERVVLHTWFCPWGSYAARIPDTKAVSNQFETLTVEKIYINSLAQYN